MSYGDRENDQDSYEPHPASRPPWEAKDRDRGGQWHPDHWDRPLRHSGFGIASFIVSILAGLFLFLLFGVAALLAAAHPGGLDENSPQAILVGLMIIGALLMALLGVALGIVGLVQSNRSRTFAVLGLLFNAFLFLGGLGLICAGMLTEG